MANNRKVSRVAKVGRIAAELEKTVDRDGVFDIVALDGILASVERGEFDIEPAPEVPDIRVPPSPFDMPVLHERPSVDNSPSTWEVACFATITIGDDVRPRRFLLSCAGFESQAAAVTAWNGLFESLEQLAARAAAQAGVKT